MFRITPETFISAASKGDEAIVQKYIDEHGSNPLAINVTDPRGSTALTAASAQGHLAIVNLLLTIKGIDLDKAGDNGYNPLIWAMYNDFPGIALALVQAGAKCDVQDKWGNTPLYLAVSVGNVVCVAAMLAKGDNIFSVKQANTKRTALEQADYLVTTEQDQSKKAIYASIAELIRTAMAQEQEKTVTPTFSSPRQ